MVERNLRTIELDNLNMSWKAYEKTDSSIFSQHFHNYYELIFFIKASSDYVIENNVYPVSDGDIVLIAPGKYHFLMPSKGEYYERLVFHFHPSFLLCDGILPEAYEKTEYLCKKEHPETTLVMSQMLNLCKTLSDEHLIIASRAKLTELLIRLLYMPRIDNSEYAITDKITSDAIKYISNNLATIQYIDDISNALFLSRSTLQHSFKTSMQIPIMQYVRNKKVVVAKTLIQNGYTPSDAAVAVGFSEYSTFFRCYKSFYGHSPKSEQ